MYSIERHPIQRQSGQALLLLLMMIALGITIVATASYKATGDTRQTKQSQEGGKAFHAAEGYLESALAGVTVTPIIDFNPNITPIAVTAAEAEGLVADITKDNQYTIYLRRYDAATNTFASGNYPTNTLKIYYTVPGACPAFELTFIRNDDTPTRYYTRSCITYFTALGVPYRDNVFNVTNDTVLFDTIDDAQTITYDSQPRTFTRSFTINTTDLSGSKLLIVRSLLANTTIGIRPDSGLLPQRRKVSATARTASGAQKTVEALVAYPQIPAQFFVTSF